MQIPVAAWTEELCGGFVTWQELVASAIRDKPLTAADTGIQRLSDVRRRLLMEREQYLAETASHLEFQSAIRQQMSHLHHDSRGFRAENREQEKLSERVVIRVRPGIHLELLCMEGIEEMEGSLFHLQVYTRVYASSRTLLHLLLTFPSKLVWLDSPYIVMPHHAIYHQLCMVASAHKH